MYRHCRKRKYVSWESLTKTVLPKEITKQYFSNRGQAEDRFLVQHNPNRPFNELVQKVTGVKIRGQYEIIMPLLFWNCWKKIFLNIKVAVKITSLKTTVCEQELGAFI